MHKMLPESHDWFLAFRVSGTLDENDYQSIVPLLESGIARYGRLCLCWEMKNLDGWTPSALWADISFDIQHRNDFDRIALIGEKQWHEWADMTLTPFTGATVRYFEPEQRQTAFAWCSKSGTWSSLSQRN